MVACGVSPASSTSSPPVSSYRLLLLQLCSLLFRWLCLVPSMIYSSQPTRFLPNRRKHQHHQQHQQRQTSTNTNKHEQQQQKTNNITHATSTNTNVAGTAIGGSSHPSTPTAAGASVSGPPPPPFLSPYSFPLPSSCLPGARYFFNLADSPWPIRFWHRISPWFTSSTIDPNTLTLGSGPDGGTYRPNNGAEALAMLARRNHSHHHKKKWTLILDLDETLVHTTTQPLADYDCRVEIHTRRAQRVFYIAKRPYLDTFLATLATAFDIVIFTASIRRYADAVIDLIDVHRVVNRRYFRQSCVKQGASFLKDIRGVVPNGDLRRSILIDNSPIAYSMQEENALPITTWIDDPNDTALRDLIPFLLALRSLDDVRPVLYRRHLLGRTVELATTAAEVCALPQPQIPVTSSIIEEDEGEEEEEEEEEEYALNTTRRNAMNTRFRRG